MCTKKHVKQNVHLSEINWNNFQSSYFSEYSRWVFSAVQGQNLWQNCNVVKLRVEVLQLYYNGTPPWVIFCKFKPEYPRAAASIHSLIKLLFSTKSMFFEIFSHFVPYLSFRRLSLFYQRELETGNLFTFHPVLFLLANIMVPFFINRKILLILFWILFFYLVRG